MLTTGNSSPLGATVVTAASTSACFRVTRQAWSYSSLTGRMTPSRGA